MSDVNSPVFWEEIYQQGAPWDLGGPTPVFRRLLLEDRLPPGRMIVLGAGHGHDARMFARWGFEVTAVDFAAEAVQAMRDLAEPEAPVEVLQTDIFDLPSRFNHTFDYILEYTCFCAIDPQRRPEYADLVKRLLKPEGTYIALLFPVTQRNGGPPYPVAPDELAELLSRRGFNLQRHEESPPDSVPRRRGVEELLIFTKNGRIR